MYVVLGDTVQPEFSPHHSTGRGCIGVGIATLVDHCHEPAVEILDVEVAPQHHREALERVTAAAKHTKLQIGNIEMRGQFHIVDNALIIFSGNRNDVVLGQGLVVPHKTVDNLAGDHTRAHTTRVVVSDTASSLGIGLHVVLEKAYHGGAHQAAIGGVDTSALLPRFASNGRWMVEETIAIDDARSEVANVVGTGTVGPVKKLAGDCLLVDLTAIFDDGLGNAKHHVGVVAPITLGNLRRVVTLDLVVTSEPVGVSPLDFFFTHKLGAHTQGIAYGLAIDRGHKPVFHFF